MKKIILLGSTGSVGVQTLEVARLHKIEVAGLSAHTNRELLEKQAREFGVAPEMVCLSSENPDGLQKLAATPGCIVFNAVVGCAGLEPTLAALNAGNPVALANKESLVAGGRKVMRLSRATGVPVIPVDSEHSAIMLCLSDRKKDSVAKIILTASGGPFLGYTKEQLRCVTREQALRNPNWSMGAKITVDSATLMNKGLELIEAMYLFDVAPEQIEVVIHPQSIIHSAVEFTDGTVIAQLSTPDMRLPIQYALLGKHAPSQVKRLSLSDVGSLTFGKPDCETFPCLEYARMAACKGGDAPRLLNAANEEAVAAFLKGDIAFYEIPEYIYKEIQHCL